MRFTRDLTRDLTRDMQTRQEVPKGRRNACGVSLKNNVYFIGGIYNKDVSTGRVDCFDMDEDRWQLVESMNEPRFCAAACTMNGELRAVSHRGQWSPKSLLN